MRLPRGEEEKKIIRDSIKAFAILAVIALINFSGLWKEIAPWVIGGLGILLALAVGLVVIWLLWRFALHLLWMVVRTVSNAWRG